MYIINICNNSTNPNVYDNSTDAVQIHKKTSNAADRALNNPSATTTCQSRNYH